MKLIALLTLGSLLLLFGCASSNSATVPTTGGASADSVAEREYRDKFVSISKRLDDIPKADANASNDVFLQALKESHEKEREVIMDLADLKPPKKFSEFHRVLVEWKKERWALDEEGIGYVANKEQDKIDELSGRIDEVGEMYTKRIDDIVKANGYTSTEKFLGIE